MPFNFFAQVPDLETLTKLGQQNDRVLFIVALALLVGMGGYMLKVFIKKTDDKDAALLQVTKQYSDDAKSVSVALDKTSEAVRDNTEAIKQWALSKGATALVILSLLFSVGCTTFSNVATTKNLAALAEVAAYTGTTYQLQQDAGSLPAFQVAHEAVKKLIDTQNYDPSALASALAGLHVRELKGPKGQLLISSTLILWDAYAPDITAIDSKQKVLPILQALDKGIGKALADFVK